MCSLDILKAELELLSLWDEKNNTYKEEIKEFDFSLNKNIFHVGDTILLPLINHLYKENYIFKRISGYAVCYNEKGVWSIDSLFNFFQIDKKISHEMKTKKEISVLLGKLKSSTGKVGNYYIIPKYYVVTSSKNIRSVNQGKNSGRGIDMLNEFHFKYISNGLLLNKNYSINLHKLPQNDMQLKLNSNFEKENFNILNVEKEKCNQYEKTSINDDLSDAYIDDMKLSYLKDDNIKSILVVDGTFKSEEKTITFLETVINIIDDRTEKLLFPNIDENKNC